MIPIPYLREVLGGLLAVSLIVNVVQGVKAKVLGAELDAAVAQTEVCYQNVTRCQSTVVGLREQIEDQNAAIQAAIEAGNAAQAAQHEADLLAQRLDNANRLIRKIQSENVDLRDQAKELDTCSTCLLVSQSIAGALP